MNREIEILNEDKIWYHKNSGDRNDYAVERQLFGTRFLLFKILLVTLHPISAITSKN